MCDMKSVAQDKICKITSAAGAPTGERAISQALPTSTEKVMVQKRPKLSEVEGSYGQHGVISEEERVGDNLPRSIPVDVFLVNEDPHEFRDG